ncbi:hypothetical protein Tco_1500588 [Tanacetum coccineum]
MAPKRTPTSAAPAMSQAAIRKLVINSAAVALEAQAAIMANVENTNRNIGQSGTPVARKCSYKEFMSYQPFNFKGTEGAVGLIRWFKRIESVFSCSNYTEDYKVKFATGDYPEVLKEILPLQSLKLWRKSLPKPRGILEAFPCELQKQRASHWKQPTTSIRNLSCLRRERALQKSVLKSKQQCPRKSILAEGQERSPRPECSHDFDVVIGMDWLSKYHAKIICDEKVVHIPIDGETLIIQGVAPVARSPYRLAPSEMQELSNQLQELAD